MGGRGGEGEKRGGGRGEPTQFMVWVGKGVAVWRMRVGFFLGGGEGGGKRDLSTKRD